MGTVMAVYVGRRGSPFAVGMVSTAFFFGLVVFAPVWGAVADLTGRRRAVLVSGGVLATLSILPLVVVDGVWGPIAVRLLFSVFAAGFLPVMLTIVSERGGMEGRGRTIGSFNSARSVGFTGARFFAGVLLGVLAPAGVYLVVAAVSLVATVAAVLVDDPTPDPDRELTLAELRTGVRQRLFPSMDERDHLTTNGLQWLYVAVALRNMSWLGLASLLPVFLIVEVGASEFVMGALLALSPIVEVACMYAFGRATDTVGRKPLITVGIGGHVVVGVLMAAATLPSSPLVGQVTAGTAMVAKGVVYSATLAGAVAFIGDVTPVDRQSELMGLHSTAKGVGGVLGPVVVGAIATVTTYEAAFVVAALIAAVGTLIVWRMLVESYPDASTDRAIPFGED
jgi:MFS family permease